MFTLLLLTLPGCFDFPGGDETPDESSTTDTGMSSSGSSTSSGMSSTSTATASSGTSGSSDADCTDSETTAGECTDECQPELTVPCSEDGTSTIDCVLTESGCYEYTSTSCGDAICVPDQGCVALPASCAEVLAGEPGAADGVYAIDPDGLGGLAPVDVLCDMSTDGGGWTLIAYNDQTTTFVEFDRSWQEYKDGFGTLTLGGLGWLGNDRIHALTLGGVELQVRHDHPWVNAYADFSVGDEASLYQLAVTTTPASLDQGWFESFHDGLPFSTFDNENDTHAANNCADVFRAGWWYADCHVVSIASADSPAPAASQVYWRPQAGGGPLLVQWIGMWIR